MLPAANPSFLAIINMWNMILGSKGIRFASEGSVYDENYVVFLTLLQVYMSSFVGNDHFQIDKGIFVGLASQTPKHFFLKVYLWPKLPVFYVVTD